MCLAAVQDQHNTTQHSTSFQGIQLPSSKVERARAATPHGAALAARCHDHAPLVLVYKLSQPPAPSIILHPASSQHVLLPLHFSPSPSPRITSPFSLQYTPLHTALHADITHPHIRPCPVLSWLPLSHPVWAGTPQTWSLGACRRCHPAPP